MWVNMGRVFSTVKEFFVCLLHCGIQDSSGCKCWKYNSSNLKQKKVSLRGNWEVWCRFQTDLDLRAQMRSPSFDSTCLYSVGFSRANRMSASSCRLLAFNGKEFFLLKPQISLEKDFDQALFDLSVHPWTSHCNQVGGYAYASFLSQNK